MIGLGFDALDPRVLRLGLRVRFLGCRAEDGA